MLVHVALSMCGTVRDSVAVPDGSARLLRLQPTSAWVGDGAESISRKLMGNATNMRRIKYLMFPPRILRPTVLLPRHVLRCLPGESWYEELITSCVGSVRQLLASHS